MMIDIVFYVKGLFHPFQPNIMKAKLTPIRLEHSIDGLATHKQKLRDNGTEALKNGAALFCTEYGSTQATGDDAYDPAETQIWWNWLADNDVSGCNWSAAALAEVSAAFKPGTNGTGPWTDAMLKPSGLLVRNYIISKYSLAAKASDNRAGE
jgi:hypothetical protein